MGGGLGDVIALGQGGEAVGAVAGVDQAGEFERVENVAGRCEIGAGEDGEVEADVLADDGGVGEEVFDVEADAVEVGRVGDVGGGDGGELLDAQGDVALGVDELGVGGLDAITGEADHADLSDAVATDIETGGLQVE